MFKLRNISLWVLGSIIISLGFAIAFIIGLSVGLKLDGSLTHIDDTLPTWVAALATVCIAILTIILARETWALRRIQLEQIDQIRKDSIKPSIDLYLKSAPAAYQFMDIHVVNGGSGVAENIKFTFTNQCAEAQDVYDHLHEKIKNLVILSKGISSLGVGEKRTSHLFSFIDLNRKFEDRMFNCIVQIDIQFQDIEGKNYTSRSHFNFTEYKGLREVGGGEPLYDISSTLKNLQKDIGHFASGFKKLKAEIYTSADREKESDDLKAHRDK